MMGRWMSPDWSAKEEPVPYAKLDNPQSLNLYGYVENNPLGAVDADGHQQAGPPPQETDLERDKEEVEPARRGRPTSRNGASEDLNDIPFREFLTKFSDFIEEKDLEKAEAAARNAPPLSPAGCPIHARSLRMSGRLRQPSPPIHDISPSRIERASCQLTSILLRLSDSPVYGLIIQLSNYSHNFFFKI